jgi:glycosyltransferase involved in cell wall biosynthesis
LNAYTAKNIIYGGFVDDINVYFKGADIFINPVTDGGGIKTKLVEALGYGLSVVSTKSGAIGIPLSVTGNKLYCIENTDWPGFAKAIAGADPGAAIPSTFFDHFYWGNITAKVKSIIS